MRPTQSTLWGSWLGSWLRRTASRVRPHSKVRLQRWPDKSSRRHLPCRVWLPKKPCEWHPRQLLVRRLAPTCCLTTANQRISPPKWFGMLTHKPRLARCATEAVQFAVSPLRFGSGRHRSGNTCLATMWFGCWLRASPYPTPSRPKPDGLALSAAQRAVWPEDQSRAAEAEAPGPAATEVAAAPLTIGPAGVTAAAEADCGGVPEGTPSVGFTRRWLPRIASRRGRFGERCPKATLATLGRSLESYCHSVRRRSRRRVGDESPTVSQIDQLSDAFPGGNSRLLTDVLRRVHRLARPDR